MLAKDLGFFGPAPAHADEGVQFPWVQVVQWRVLLRYPLSATAASTFSKAAGAVGRDSWVVSTFPEVADA